MEATGDRSAIVSASLPQLVQYSGQGFNQLHLPAPALHSVSLSLTPHPNHFSDPAWAWMRRCMFMPLCSHSLIACFPLSILLHYQLLPVSLLPLFLHWLHWLHHWLLWPSDSLDLTFRHCVHLLFISVNTAQAFWFMRRLSISNAAWPIHLDALWKTSILQTGKNLNPFSYSCELLWPVFYVRNSDLYRHKLKRRFDCICQRFLLVN